MSRLVVLALLAAGLGLAAPALADVEPPRREAPGADALDLRLRVGPEGMRVEGRVGDRPVALRLDPATLERLGREVEREAARVRARVEREAERLRDRMEREADRLRREVERELDRRGWGGARPPATIEL
jgi:hypothetical protein